MHKLLSKIIRQAILRQKQVRPGEKQEYSAFELAKGFRELKITVFSGFKNILWVATGIASATFGLKGFLLPSNFIDGGTTGISLLVSETTGLELYLLLLLINIPFIFLGYKVIGKQFAIKTALAIAGLLPGGHAVGHLDEHVAHGAVAAQDQGLGLDRLVVHLGAARVGGHVDGRQVRRRAGVAHGAGDGGVALLQVGDGVVALADLAGFGVAGGGRGIGRTGVVAGRGLGIRLFTGAAGEESQGERRAGGDPDESELRVTH
jgi:hypothetical protein